MQAIISTNPLRRTGNPAITGVHVQTIANQRLAPPNPRKELNPLNILSLSVHSNVGRISNIMLTCSKIVNNKWGVECRDNPHRSCGCGMVSNGCMVVRARLQAQRQRLAERGRTRIKIGNLLSDRGRGRPPPHPLFLYYRSISPYENTKRQRTEIISYTFDLPYFGVRNMRKVAICSHFAAGFGLR